MSKGKYYTDVEILQRDRERDGEDYILFRIQDEDVHAKDHCVVCND
jgi:hypothetical protein